MGGRLKLGQILLSKELISPEQLAAALGEQERWGSRLGMTLVRMGFVEEEALIRVLAGQLRLPVARIRGKSVNSEVLEFVPVELAEKYRCLPLFVREEGGAKTLFLAMEDPSDLEALDDLSFQIGEKLRPVLVAPTELEDALQRHYHGAALMGPADALPPVRVSQPRRPDPEDAETAPELPPLDPLLDPGPEPAAFGFGSGARSWRASRDGTGSECRAGLRGALGPRALAGPGAAGDPARPRAAPGGEGRHHPGRVRGALAEHRLTGAPRGLATARGAKLDTVRSRSHISSARRHQRREVAMRLEYGFQLSEIEVPRFSVEVVEGIGKLFTLATLVLNVLETKPKVEIVFHGLNPGDPEAKIDAFKEIVSGSETGAELRYEFGKGGQIPGSSSSFRWITVST